jgi:GTP-binding protein HflX
LRSVDPRKFKPDTDDSNAKGLDTRLAPTRSLVLCPVLQKRNGAAARAGASVKPLSRTPQAQLEEAIGLARAIGLEICSSGIVQIAKPRPGTLLGSGKVEELRGIIAAEDIDLVIVDHPLTPVQQRNLEKAWSVKVLDRTGLILEIFGDRAQTREGRLQVELAHLTYQKSRLVRSWTHLERQRGGVGFLGGPGETQIESDRRALQGKITRLRRELEQVKRTRSLHRKSRKRVPYAIIALVGYTNAGKSTLFNHVTGADVAAEDQLFATLDPTMREIQLPGGTKAILSDTVGFISNLPTGLIAAFRATLEEVLEADLILHVRDIASEESEAQARDVENVLGELGIEASESQERIMQVWNKVDLLDAERASEISHAAERTDGGALCVSAITGEGLPALLSGIEARLNASDREVEITLDPGEGALVNWLHENTQILSSDTDGQGRTTFHLRISKPREQQFTKRFANRPSASAAE